MYTNVVFKS